MKTALFILTSLLFLACSNDPEPNTEHKLSFGAEQKVTVLDYNDHIMEPFLSRDGTTLFFNNLNYPSVNTNLHYATRIDDITFQYKGEVKGVNTESLEGVPTMTSSNSIYFVSTRSYDTSFSTLYSGDFNTDSISNVELLTGISKNTAGWVNFDVEISADGNYLYTVDGLYDANGGPYEAGLVLAENSGNTFQRVNNLTLAFVNTNELEYAACISSNMLELYFTRVAAPLTITSVPQIYVTTRTTVKEPFGKPYKINEITGFVEGPTISPDNQLIYYHKKVNETYGLYMVRKK